uniref:Scavenger receptor class B n=1 Tax=Anopheles epiroticus TaxID=199890 RepID=A0A182PM51_9DIPT
MRCCRWYLGVGLGLGTAATGFIFLFAWRDIFDILVSEEKSLLPGTALYKEWRRPPMRPTWQMYVYNWSNAQAFLEHAPEVNAPNFEEFGPYEYDEITEVVDVKFHQANDTLSYRKRTFFRRSALQTARNSESKPEEITTVNFVALLASHLGRRMDYSVQRELSFMMHNFHQNLTVTRPVGQLLLAGYREPMMDPMRKLVCTNKSHSTACQDERLAYFRTFNVSRRASELYSLNVGSKDPAKYGTVRSWSRTAARSGPEESHSCDGLDDLTGEFFPSRIERGAAIRLVLPELCRRLTLEFDREQSVEGIVGYRYQVRPVRPFSAELADPGMERCPHASIRLGRYGILNSNECHGLPLYESDLANASASDQHSTATLSGGGLYYVLEPVTGSVLESNLALAYHTFLRPNEHIALLQSVPLVRVPLFRFTRFHRLSDAKAAKLRQLLHLLDVGHQLALAGCVVGAAIVILSALYACWEARKPRKAHNDEYRIIGTQLSNEAREDHLLKSF